ncbi:MAG: hypothetical protein KIT34_14400 [Cyanobacteria bacterium TGS_CYA1]|nr:hypothetical protein [Cyanobacteria bacterium TGS_CYA1]
MKSDLNKPLNIIKAFGFSLIICICVWLLFNLGLNKTFANLGSMIFCGADKGIAETNDFIEKLRKIGKPSEFDLFKSVWPAFLFLFITEALIMHKKLAGSLASKSSIILNQVKFVALVLFTATTAFSISALLEYNCLLQAVRSL